MTSTQQSSPLAESSSSAVTSVIIRQILRVLDKPIILCEANLKLKENLNLLIADSLILPIIPVILYAHDQSSAILSKPQPQTRSRHRSLPSMSSRSRRKPCPSPRRKHTTRLRLRTITAQHEPIGLRERRLEISPNPRNIEARPEARIVREIARNDEPRRLRVQQDQIGVADVGGREVGDLG